MMRALAVLPLVLACASEPQDDRFADVGTPSTSASELMAKRDAVTSSGIAGVYERTGRVTGLYPSQSGTSTYRVQSDWVLRTEFRHDKLVTALQCALTYEEATRPPRTLVVFTQQDAVATDAYYDVVSAGVDVERDLVSMSDCKIDQPPVVWPYCNASHNPDYYNEIPDGANDCLGRFGQWLNVTRGSQTPEREFGRKVAN